jgi:hypothetical protein
MLPLDAIEDFQGGLKKRGKREIEQIITSLERFGFSFPFFVWQYEGHNYCLDGHGRIAALAELRRRGYALPVFPVVYVDAADENEAKQKLLRLNSQYGTMTVDTVLEFMDGLEIEGPELALPSGYLDLDELEGQATDTGPAPSLFDRFMVPPFSVLNARSGWWQDRKRAWIELGIKSEEGRTVSGAALHSLHNSPARAESTQKIIAAGPEASSVFDPVLTEIAYRWFSPEAGLVLDPFAGGSVRGIVASKLGRRYVGHELRVEQVEANRAQAATLCAENPPTWIIGDSRNIDTTCADLEADFVFSCPPYADLEVYSDDPADLSTLGYAEFQGAYSEIVRKTCSCLREDRFACFVVGEVRDKRGNYYDFVGDTVRAFMDAGLSYYNEAILVTSVASTSLRAGKQFSASRKLGKTHQNVLVFVKGDGKKAAQACGEVEVDESLLAHEGGEID